MALQSLAEDAVIARAESALSSQVEDRVMIMDIDKGTYYEIDQSAARIWDLLEQPKRFGELCDQLCRTYEVEKDQCRSDTGAFLGELAGLGLIRFEK